MTLPSLAFGKDTYSDHFVEKTRIPIMLENLLSLSIAAIFGAITSFFISSYFFKKSIKQTNEDFRQQSILEKTQRVKMINDNFHTGSELLESISTSLETIDTVIDRTTAYPIETIYKSGSKAQGLICESQVYMQNLENTITQLTTETTRLTERLYAHLKMVNTKIQVIHNIANQTDLLSINAAIEAARLGESGWGFSVVAEDMARLADISGAAAEDISNIMTSGIKDIEENKQKMDCKMTTFSEVSTHVFEKFNDMTASINLIAELSLSLKDKSTYTMSEVKDIGDKTKMAMDNVSKMLSDVLGVLSGFVIEDVAAETMYDRLSDYKIIDVRAPEEFNNRLGHLDRATLMTLNSDFEDKFSHLDHQKNYLFVCNSGAKSARAARIAQSLGFKNIANLSGGMSKWRELYPENIDDLAALS